MVLPHTVHQSKFPKMSAWATSGKSHIFGICVLESTLIKIAVKISVIILVSGTIKDTVGT